MKCKTYNLDFLDVKIHVAIVYNVVAYRNHEISPKYNFPVCDSEFSAVHVHDYKLHHGHHWLVLPDDCTPGMIAHEALHCVELIDKFFVIKSKEFRAYLLDYLVDEILNLKETNDIQTIL